MGGGTSQMYYSSNGDSIPYDINTLPVELQKQINELNINIITGIVDVYVYSYLIYIYYCCLKVYI